MRIPVTTLNDGYDFPLLGLGTYKLTGDEVEPIVRTAIELGYRHIDTAALYDNEVEVGKAINAAIKAGAPQLHPEAPGNQVYDWVLGDEGAAP